MLDQFFCEQVYSLQLLTLIRVFGDDAEQFLHQQLSNAVTDLDSASLRLGGLCSVKGRLLASMHYWKQDDAVMLLVSRDVAVALVKRLSMFVLRAKVKIEIADHAYQIVPLIGEVGKSNAEPVPAGFPEIGRAVDISSGKLLRFEDAKGFCRLLWIAPVAAEAMQNALVTPYPDYLRIVNPLCWEDLEVHAGVPRITLATQDQFVPQMINFELVGGVNFKKGCYPGQEIVARSQYRGTVKRRLQLAHISLSKDATIAAGMELFHSEDPQQPCGMVVNAAFNCFVEQGWDVLVEIKLAALENGSVHVNEAEGPRLVFSALPYQTEASQSSSS